MYSYDSETHRYTKDGAEIPSVTQALAAAGFYPDSSWYTEASRDRGRAVHQCCEYISRGIWKEEGTHPEIVPYGKAFQKFVEDAGWQCWLTETSLFCDSPLFAGTLDQFGYAENFQEWMILDFKSGKPPAAAKLQGCLYHELICKNLGMACELQDCQPLAVAPETFAVLHLREDGTYRMPREYCMPIYATDKRIALAQVDSWHWKRNHKLLRNGDGR